MEYGLSTLLKLVGSLMRLFKLYDLPNCSKNVLEIPVLKITRSNKIIKLENRIEILKNRNQVHFQYGVNS